MPYTKSGLQVEQRAAQGRMRKPGMSDRQAAIGFALGCRDLSATVAPTVLRGVARIGVSR